MQSDRLKAADKLLQAAHEFWKSERNAGMQGAVKWVLDEDGSLVIFTRGEYREQLMRNITELPGAGEYFFSDTAAAELGRNTAGDGGGT